MKRAVYRLFLILGLVLSVTIANANIAQAASYGYDYNFTIQTKDNARRSCAGSDGNGVWRTINPRLARIFPVA